MSRLLRSLMLLLSWGIMFSFADVLHAQGPPPLPAPPRPDTTQLENLRDRFSHAGVTTSQPAQTAQQDVQFPENLPPAGSATRQASFMTTPIPSPAESENLFGEELRGNPQFGFFEEDEMYDPSGEYHHMMLDRPLSGRSAELGDDEEESGIGGWRNKLAKPNITPFISVGGTLLIVIAAFFFLAILLRKVSPPSTRPLPKDAFECLGRHYLTQKHQVQLLRLGSRIVLVSVMPGGVSTLVEITDPDEAVSLLGLCRRLDANSSTEMFRKTVAMSDTDLGRQHHRPVVASQRGGHSASSLDLYSEPDESLAAVLARGRQYGR